MPNNMDNRILARMQKIGSLSQKLSRCILHNMARHGPKLEREQRLLARLVNIGAELFAMACANGQAQSILKKWKRYEAQQAMDTSGYIQIRGEHRIAGYFRDLHAPMDQPGYQPAQSLLKE